MNQSTWKIPFVAHHLIKKVNNVKQKGNNETIKTWSRASVILPTMVGCTIAVYNGRQHVPIFISDQLIGHRLGEFVPTRTFRSHKKLKTNDRKAKRK
jgi:small subunit ribosomal protein S19